MGLEKAEVMGPDVTRDSLRKSLIDLFSSEDLPLEVLASIHADLKVARGETEEVKSSVPLSSESDPQASVDNLMQYTKDPDFVETVCRSVHQRSGLNLYDFLHEKTEVKGCEVVEEGDEEEDIFDLRGVMKGPRKGNENSRESPSFSMGSETSDGGGRLSPLESNNSEDHRRSGVPREVLDPTDGSSAVSSICSDALVIPQNGQETDSQPRRAADPPGMCSSEIAPVSTPPRRRVRKKKVAGDERSGQLSRDSPSNPADDGEVATPKTSRVRTRMKKVGDVGDNMSMVATVKTLTADSPARKKLAVKLVRKKKSGDEGSARVRSPSVSSRKSVSSTGPSSRKLSKKKQSEDLSDMSCTDYSEREKDDMIRPRKSPTKKIRSQSEHKSKATRSPQKKSLGKLFNSDRSLRSPSGNRSVASAIEFSSSRGSMNSRRSSHRKLKSSKHSKSSRRKLDRQDSDELSFADDCCDGDPGTGVGGGDPDADISREVLACLEKVQKLNSTETATKNSSTESTPSLRSPKHNAKASRRRSMGGKSSASLEGASSRSTHSAKPKKSKEKRDSLRKTTHIDAGRPTPPCRVLTKSSSLKDMMSSWADFETSPEDFDPNFTTSDEKTVKTSGGSRGLSASPTKAKKNRVSTRRLSLQNTSSSWDANFAKSCEKDSVPSRASLGSVMQKGRKKEKHDSDDVSIGDFSVNRKWQVSLNSPAKKSRRPLNAQAVPAFQ